MVRAQPVDGRLAADDRRRARRVRGDAARGGDADGAPDLGCRQAGARVDDVMPLGAAGAPAADGGARRREAAGADRDRGPGGVGGRAVVVGDTQGPAVAGGRTGDGQITAEGHEHAGAAGLLDEARAAVGGIGLGDRSQVELDPGREGHGAAPAVELDAPPAGGGNDADAGTRAAGAHEREVAIPAERAHRAADGGIDVAAGRGGRSERDGKHVAEERADRDRPPGRAVQPGELGVVAEAAAGEIERPQLVGHERSGLVERVRLRDGDLREHADRGEGARDGGLRVRGTKPPLPGNGLPRRHAVGKDTARSDGCRSRRPCALHGALRRLRNGALTGARQVCVLP